MKVRSKPSLPPSPESVRTLREFGERMGWESGDFAAVARIKTLTRAELASLGVTPNLAAQWREFYCAVKRWFPGNPSAAGRAALMHRAWKLAVAAEHGAAAVHPETRTNLIAFSGHALTQ